MTAQKKTRGAQKTSDLVLSAAGAALIAVCAWISIPLAVPVTMQTFAVFFLLSLLGGKRGTRAILIYILLGAVGVPVFSGLRAGIGALFGATGGYIMGFLLTGLFYTLTETACADRPFLAAGSLLLGLIICYAFGTVWFCAVYAKNTGPIGVGAALSSCVLPFLIPDLAKLFAALALSRRLKPLLRLR